MVSELKSFSIPALFSLFGTGFTTLLGGWDMLLQALLVFMALDYVTGFLAAVKQKRVNSEVMYWGGIRKGVVIVVVVIAASCDTLLGLDPPILRALAIWFYIGREGISIFENIGKLGVPLPYHVIRVFEQIKQRGGEEHKPEEKKRGGEQDE
jgi:toxin secretion/phage lysis holin